LQYGSHRANPRPDHNKRKPTCASRQSATLARRLRHRSFARPFGSGSATPLVNTGWLTPPNGESYTIHGTAVVPIVNPVNTGGFTGTFGGTPIVYWCFDLLHTFGLNSTLDYTASLLGGSVATQLSILYNVANANGGFGATRTIRGLPARHLEHRVRRRHLGVQRQLST
jgi:hypothetical protein